MAPKKKKDHAKSLVGAYDVEIMTEEELKDYIGALMEEEERMKLLLIQSERDKPEISDFLQSTNQEIINRIESSIQKSSEIQKKLKESYEELKDNEEKYLATEFDFLEKDAKCNFEAFQRIQLAKSLQREEKQNRRKLADGVVRESETNSMHDKFVLFNKREEVQIVSTERNLSELQSIADNCFRKYHDGIHYFQKEKCEKIMDIFELKEEVSGHSVSKYPEELAFYFKEIISKNLETITSLKSEVAKLENKQDMLKIQIRDAKRDNKRFKLVIKLSSNESLDPNLQKQISSEVKNESEIVKHNEEEILKELLYENDVLNIKLGSILKEKDVLRNSFITAKRKILEKTEFKNFLLEQMLLIIKVSNE